MNCIKDTVKVDKTDECDFCTDAYKKKHCCPKVIGATGINVLACKIEHQVQRNRG